jgi:hypothetical protein
MNSPAGYLPLVLSVRQEELLAEASRRSRSTDPIRRHRGQTLASRIGRILRPRR